MHVIFVSHSTAKDDAAGTVRLDAIEAALKGPSGAGRPFDVLLDRKRLEPGTSYRDELDEWMATSHAAVLLLTPRALESNWVLKEATILAHRNARDPKFRLFPVLLDGVTREKVTASRFSPLYLDAIERVPHTEPAAIGATVLAELDKLAAMPVTPFEKLLEALTALMKTATGTKTLEAICESITGKGVQWMPGEERAERCAREIARAVVTGKAETYAKVSILALTQDLLTAGLLQEPARRVLHLIAPLWVDTLAAAPLAELAALNLAGRKDEQGRLLTLSAALNGGIVRFTPDMYVRRAFLPDVASLLHVPGAVNDERRLDALVAGIRQAYRDDDPEAFELDDGQVDALLNLVASPYFVLLPRPLPDRDLLEQLQGKYPRVTFIAQSDPNGDELEALGGRIVPLTPRVDLTRELQEFQEFSGARKRIDKVTGTSFPGR